MPINEHLGRPSNLTREQQKEAMRAVYGLGATMTPELTYEERVKMRRMLDALDQKEAGGMKEFDLNKPPVPPYVFREYPMMLYNHETGKTGTAHNYEERRMMVGQGWSESPVPPPIPAAIAPEFNHVNPPAHPQVELTAQEREEVQELDRLARRKKA